MYITKYILLLDISCQQFGDICQLGCFCGLFGGRVGECTFCNIQYISAQFLDWRVSVRPSGAGLEDVHFVILIYICFGYECLNFEGS